ncbi:MAG: AI-2E family transporter [Myxococcales bacterium]|nr:AI-2E family transporter [Myxococcales bacterium]
MEQPKVPATPISVVGPWRWLAICALVVVSYYVVAFLADILAPVLAALGLAYLMSPLCDALVRRGLSRSVASFIIIGIISAIVPVAIAIAVPMLANDLIEFVEKLPDLLSRGSLWINSQFHTQLPTDWTDIANLGAIMGQAGDAKSMAREAATAALGGIFSILGFLGLLLVVPVFAYYFLVDWPNIQQRILHAIPPRRRQRAIELGREVNAIIAGWARGQSTVVLILAVLYSVGYSLAGLDFALPVGALAGVLTVIPYIGPIFGGVVAVLVALAQGGSIDLLAGVAIVIGVGQLVESFYLTPKIVGHSVGISESAALLAVIVGGNLFGFVGILLAVPLAATVRVLISIYYRKYEHSDFYGDEADAHVTVTPAMEAVMVEPVLPHAGDHVTESPSDKA